MPTKKAIAIFDIGKTNKKFLLLDETYTALYETDTRLPETTDEDGFPCEDILALRKWIDEMIGSQHSRPGTALAALNFSAYGASLMHLDGNREPLTPVYNYLKPYPQKILDSFYQRYGGAETFSEKTASPRLGNLNSGLQLYRLKSEKPALFSQIKYSLHFPQYLSSLISNRLASEMTSIGCHTALWDFSKNNYHEWVNAEAILPLFPEIADSGSVSPSNWKGDALICGTGIHDSSAALVPYQVQCKEPFVLLSTGTWNISLNPFNRDALTAEELAQDCLCYIDYRGKPVKASRLFAGQDHEDMLGKLAAHFQVSRDFYKSVEADLQILEKKPVVQTGHPFDPSDYSHYGEAYHYFLDGLVKRQHKALRLVMPNDDIKNIYVDGGFSRNTIFMQLLAKSFPNQGVYRAVISRASAIGAALVMHPHWNTLPWPEDLIQLEKV